MTNPYQSTFPDEFLDEQVQHELALSGYDHLVNTLRDRIRLLEAENERLAGFHMESADID